MSDREIIDTGDGGTAAIVAGLFLVALVIVGAFFFVGVNHASGTVINVDMPQIAGSQSTSVG